MKKTEKRSYRLLPCGAYDVERIQGWLTELASAGWHLNAVASSVRLFRFTQGPARPTRYRLEPKRDFNDQSEKPEEAVREVYEACGWEAVADFGPFLSSVPTTPRPGSCIRIRLSIWRCIVGCCAAIFGVIFLYCC